MLLKSVRVVGNSTSANYTYIYVEDVIARIKEEGGEVGFRNGNGPTT